MAMITVISAVSTKVAAVGATIAAAIIASAIIRIIAPHAIIAAVGAITVNAAWVVATLIVIRVVAAAIVTVAVTPVRSDGRTDAQSQDTGPDRQGRVVSVMMAVMIPTPGTGVGGDGRRHQTGGNCAGHTFSKYAFHDKTLLAMVTNNLVND
jgi:hypothetical protein